MTTETLTLNGFTTNLTTTPNADQLAEDDDIPQSLTTNLQVPSFELRTFTTISPRKIWMVSLIVSAQFKSLPSHTTEPVAPKVLPMSPTNRHKMQNKLFANSMVQTRRVNLSA